MAIVSIQIRHHDYTLPHLEQRENRPRTRMCNHKIGALIATDYVLCKFEVLEPLRKELEERFVKEVLAK